MKRRHSLYFAVAVVLFYMNPGAVVAQAGFPQIAPPTITTSNGGYYENTSSGVVGEAPSSVHYQASPGCAPLIPTIAEGLRNTLNCLLPCRGSRPLAIGGPLLGRRGGLFSVRFHDGCGCGLPAARCGCGIQVIDGAPGTPTPAGILPDANPPKPVPDASAIYYHEPVRSGGAQAVYLPRQLHHLNQQGQPSGAVKATYQAVRRTGYYRASPIPNPLRP